MWDSINLITSSLLSCMLGLHGFVETVQSAEALCFNKSVPHNHGRNIVGVPRSGTTFLHSLVVHALFVQNGAVWSQRDHSLKDFVAVDANAHHVLSQQSFFFPPALLESNFSALGVMAHGSSGNDDPDFRPTTTLYGLPPEQVNLLLRLHKLRVHEVWGGHISQIEMVDYHRRYLVQRSVTDPQISFHQQQSPDKALVDRCTGRMHQWKNLHFDRATKLQFPECSVVGGPTDQILQYFQGVLFPTNFFYAARQARCPGSVADTFAQNEPQFSKKMFGNCTDSQVCQEWRVLASSRHPIDVFLSQLNYARPGSVPAFDSTVSKKLQPQNDASFTFSDQQKACSHVSSRNGRHTQCEEYSTLSQFFNIVEWYRTMHILKLFTDVREARGVAAADEWLESGQLEDLQAVDCSQVSALAGINSTAAQLCHSYDSKFGQSTSHPNPRVLTALQIKTAVPKCLQLEWVRYPNLIDFGHPQDHEKGNQMQELQKALKFIGICLTPSQTLQVLTSAAALNPRSPSHFTPVDKRRQLIHPTDLSIMNAIVHAMLPPAFGDEPSACANSLNFKDVLREQEVTPVFGRDVDSKVPEFDFFD